MLSILKKNCRLVKSSGIYHVKGYDLSKLKAFADVELNMGQMLYLSLKKRRKF